MVKTKLDPAAEPGFETATSPAGLSEEDKQELVDILCSYKREAEENRKGGLNPRDAKWEENLNMYWGRHDFSSKAHWQAKEVMPEVPSFVDRFAAALKEAAIASGEGFFDVTDPADTEEDLTRSVKSMLRAWLTRCGRNQNGHILSFGAVFEEQVKLGALMAMCSTVVWKDDVKGGRVAIETVDPRFVWLDHTFRNLYRIRRVEVDRHELFAMSRSTDSKGRPIFNLPEMERLTAHLVAEEIARREMLSGHGQQVTSTRTPIVLDEYIATVVKADGTVLARDALMVVANGQFLIRGPEANPFWHGRDWLVFAPLVTAPLSVYGRSYMEDFGSVAKVFNELTNLILDATVTSSMRAFALAPGMLQNPNQAAEGISPNKTFLLEDGVAPRDFFHALDLGNLPAEVISVWQALKNELREAAGINEIGLGQFAPKSRTSATEVIETQQSSSALIRSIAQTIETRYLDPTLDLVWKTGIQHAKPNDPMLMEAAGAEMYSALISRRKELVSRPFTFQARGLSALIRKSQMMRALLNVMQVIAGNELLLREFLNIANMGKLVELLFELSDVDLRKLQLSEREALMRQVAEPIEAAKQRANEATAGQAAPPSTTNEAQQVAAMMGVA